MPELPTTCGVTCSRCGDRVVCALKTELVPPKPGEKSSTTIRAYIPDLATPMALHYAKAHPAPLPASVQRFSPHVENILAAYRSDDD